MIFEKSCKGESQGHNDIFKGMKMTFRTKILKKKLYHVNQHKKCYKLCFDKFSLRPLFSFGCAPVRGQFHQTRSEHHLLLRVMLAAVNLGHQEHGRCGEHSQGLILTFEESVQNRN